MARWWWSLDSLVIRRLDAQCRWLVQDRQVGDSFEVKWGKGAHHSSGFTVACVYGEETLVGESPSGWGGWLAVQRGGWNSGQPRGDDVLPRGWLWEAGTSRSLEVMEADGGLRFRQCLALRLEDGLA
jgi:hypothetical protein